MGNINLSPAALLSLLQWSDTLFPSGAFSHSFGLESAVDEKKVQNGSDLFEWVRAKLIHQLFPCDWVFLKQAYVAALNFDFSAIQKLNETAHAMRLPREVREGASMIAARMIQTGSALYPETVLTSFKKSTLRGEQKGDPAVAFALVAVSAEISLPAASFAYLYMFISGQVSASLRLLPIGQEEGQGIIHDLLTWAEKSKEMDRVIKNQTAEPMSFMPASEIACMQHETSKVRLFQS